MELPGGMVTFLLTDVEGSTQLWEEHPDEMSDVLARHLDLLGRTVGDHYGHVVKNTGDGVFAVFADAADGVRAAVAAQLALHGGAATEPIPLRARCGLHSAEAQPERGDYRAAGVNRCARIMGVAHGGQVLLSQSTLDLIDGLEEIGFLDLGHHRLLDLSGAVRLHQALHADLPAEFPPLRFLEGFANNLPAEMSSFIGRETELAELARLVDETR
ncbi:MAG: adenylate/guanylate cyclase domain-containing protein, partial [Acidimicrobiia bacterium]